MPDLPVTTASLDLDGVDRFHSLSRELGVESFGISLMELAPGQRNRVHVHQRQEEVYLVVEGELTLVVEGEDMSVGVGELVRVAPPVRRQLANRGAAPVRLLALGSYGDGHEPRDALAWTDWDEGGEGRQPREVPLPDDLPAAGA